MPQELEKICSLLNEGSAELQCAAALVLGELKSKDAGVRKALVRALQSGNETVRLYSVEALAKIGAREAVPHLIPLLGAGPAVKARAMKVITEAGTEVVKELRDRMKGADPEVRKGIAEALGALGEEDVLLRALKDPDPAVANSVLAQVGRFKGKAKEVYAILKSGKGTVPCLQILGEIGEPKWIVPYVDRKHPPEVRAAAFRSLAKLGVDASILPKLLPVLDEEGDPRPALDVLERMKIGKADAKKVLKLLAHPKPAVRVSAIRALGSFADAAGPLADALASPDREVSEAAAAALRSNAAFVPALVKVLEERSDWKIADAIRAHPLDAKLRKSLLAKCLGLVEKRQDRYRLFFEILRTVALDELRAALLKRGRDLLAKKKFDESEHYLRLLEPDDIATHESTYALALARLKQRKNDPAIALFGKLVHSEFPVAKQLEKDKPLLAAGDLLHLGFRFIERQGTERDFGAEVMKLIVKKYGSSHEAKVAKQKLKTQGLG